jgi:hypothetical protein
VPAEGSGSYGIEKIQTQETEASGNRKRSDFFAAGLVTLF